MSCVKFTGKFARFENQRKNASEKLTVKGEVVAQEIEKELFERNYFVVVLLPTIRAKVLILKQ